MKKVKIFGLFLIMSFLPFVLQAGSKVPSDLKVKYEFIQGGPEKGATIETYLLEGNKLTLTTDYIPTQYGSDASKRVKENKTYTMSKEKMEELWQIIENSRFMTWTDAPSQRPPQGGNQSFTITANGKTATHTMWENPNKESFIDFSREFLKWAKQLMTIQL
ncbi:MAG: hypothetical protein JNK65_05905 [Deltaproteobacteria bacterium]|nr:hypothetical protein [Deltaproteobacteria bacterium]